MVRTICAGSAGRGGRMIASAGALALAGLLASGPQGHAQSQDNILKQAFKVFGFATDAPPPADFVAKTRPPDDLHYIPVFQPPPEPERPALKADQLKAVRSDLDGVEKRHDVLRKAFPPAAKALAEEQAAKKKPKSNAAGAQK